MSNAGRESSSRARRMLILFEMMYLTNVDLPDTVRRSLPVAAQDIFRIAFNEACQRLGDGHEPRAERLAWGAVRRAYMQRGIGIWLPRSRSGLR